MADLSSKFTLADSSPSTLRTASWTVYDELNNRTLSGRGYATGSAGSYTYVLIDPVNITIVDDNDRPIESIVSARTGGSGRLSASDSFGQGGYSRWSTNTYDDHGQLTAARVYFLIPSTGGGSEGTNYDTTAFGYDTTADRRIKVASPGGTITRTVFDVRGLPTAIFVGANDTGATPSDPTGGGASGNNMTQVSGNVYDGGSAGGDGTRTTELAQPFEAGKNACPAGISRRRCHARRKRASKLPSLTILRQIARKFLTALELS